MQLTLDRNSPWLPSMGNHTASAMDDALQDRDDAPENEREATWSVESARVGVLAQNRESRPRVGTPYFPAYRMGD